MLSITPEVPFWTSSRLKESCIIFPLLNAYFAEGQKKIQKPNWNIIQKYTSLSQICLSYLVTAYMKTKLLIDIHNYIQQPQPITYP